jgi:hypothetical protein
MGITEIGHQEELGFSIVLRLVQESHQITNGVEFRAFLFHRHDQFDQIERVGERQNLAYRTLEFLWCARRDSVQPP